ncbi:MAG: hypothetical protein MZV70_66835 [Desulfobacterales bacterium]|nr:hypothetical protein [Desulfobacterales bacterium]
MAHPQAGEASRRLGASWPTTSAPGCRGGSSRGWPCSSSEPRRIMKAEIIAVGTELLTPDFQDTNSLLSTAGLNALGIARLVQDHRRRRRGRPRPRPADGPRPLRPRPVHGRARADRGRPDPRDPGQGPGARSLSSGADHPGPHPRSGSGAAACPCPPRTSSSATSSRGPRSWTIPTAPPRAYGSRPSRRRIAPAARPAAGDPAHVRGPCPAPAGRPRAGIDRSGASSGSTGLGESAMENRLEPVYADGPGRRDGDDPGQPGRSRPST